MRKCGSEGNRNVFSQMIGVAKSRNMRMKGVLVHPLGQLPWTLAHADGSLRNKTVVFAMDLEQNVSPEEAIPT